MTINLWFRTHACFQVSERQKDERMWMSVRLYVYIYIYNPCVAVLCVNCMDPYLCNVSLQVTTLTWTTFSLFQTVKEYLTSCLCFVLFFCSCLFVHMVGRDEGRGDSVFLSFQVSNNFFIFYFYICLTVCVWTIHILAMIPQSQIHNSLKMNFNVNNFDKSNNRSKFKQNIPPPPPFPHTHTRTNLSPLATGKRNFESKITNQKSSNTSIASQILRVSDQNGIFQLYIIVEIYHSGQKPSTYNHL